MSAPPCRPGGGGRGGSFIRGLRRACLSLDRLSLVHAHPPGIPAGPGVQTAAGLRRPCAGYPVPMYASRSHLRQRPAAADRQRSAA